MTRKRVAKYVRRNYCTFAEKLALVVKIHNIFIMLFSLDHSVTTLATKLSTTTNKGIYFR